MIPDETPKKYLAIEFEVGHDSHGMSTVAKATKVKPILICDSLQELQWQVALLYEKITWSDDKTRAHVETEEDKRSWTFRYVDFYIVDYTGEAK